MQTPNLQLHGCKAVVPADTGISYWEFQLQITIRTNTFHLQASKGSPNDPVIMDGLHQFTQSKYLHMIIIETK